MPVRRLGDEFSRKGGKIEILAGWIMWPEDYLLTAMQRRVVQHGRKKLGLLRDAAQGLKASMARALHLEGFTNAEIARQLGVSERTLRNWRRRKPSFVQARRLERDKDGYAYLRFASGGLSKLMVFRVACECGEEAFACGLAGACRVEDKGVGYCRACKRRRNFTVIAQRPAPYESVREWQISKDMQYLAIAFSKSAK